MGTRRVLSLAAAAGLATMAACDRAAESPVIAGADLPDRSVYCYVTIADDDCYAAPQPGQEARLLRAWPPVEQRTPSPSAKAAAGAP